MARPTNRSTLTPSRALSVDEMRQGIERLKQRVADIRSFDVASKVRSDKNPPEITALGAAVERTLAKIFGEGTPDYNRYVDASALPATFIAFSENYPAQPHYAHQIKENLINAEALLQEAIRGLEEEIAFQPTSRAAPETKAAKPLFDRKVFIVHGHDEGVKNAVARFLEKVGFEPIILSEQTNQGRTIIEKFEAHADVGFAVVLLTPDDEGCAKGKEAQPRARQNVILELGYFIGKLGRARVCALKSAGLEIPSDILGVLWTDYDQNGGWQTALARELQAAGYEIDWNTVMRP